MKILFFILYCFVYILYSGHVHAQGVVVDTIHYGPDTVYIMPDYTASFPGGKTRMWEYFRMKFDPYVDGIGGTTGPKEGTMEFSFVVETTGKIKYVVMNKSISPAFDDEVSRTLLSMPKWEPARYQGRKVRSLQTGRYTLNFRP